MCIRDRIIRPEAFISEIFTKISSPENSLGVVSSMNKLVSRIATERIIIANNLPLILFFDSTFYHIKS